MGASASHGGGGGASTEAPPPTYEEAMFLIGDEKLRVVLEESKYAARLVCLMLHFSNFISQSY